VTGNAECRVPVSRPDTRSSTVADAGTVTTGALITRSAGMCASAAWAIACLFSLVAAPIRNQPIRASHRLPRLCSVNSEMIP
jgi:hypothetical protein